MFLFFPIFSFTDPSGVKRLKTYFYKNTINVNSTNLPKQNNLPKNTLQNLKFT